MTAGDFEPSQDVTENRGNDVTPDEFIFTAPKPWANSVRNRAQFGPEAT